MNTIAGNVLFGKVLKSLKINDKSVLNSPEQYRVKWNKDNLPTNAVRVMADRKIFNEKEKYSLSAVIKGWKNDTVLNADMENFSYIGVPSLNGNGARVFLIDGDTLTLKDKIDAEFNANRAETIREAKLQAFQTETFVENSFTFLANDPNKAMIEKLWNTAKTGRGFIKQQDNRFPDIYGKLTPDEAEVFNQWFNKAFDYDQKYGRYQREIFDSEHHNPQKIQGPIHN